MQPGPSYVKDRSKPKGFLERAQQNRAFKVRHALSYSGRTSTEKKTRTLSEVTQPAFEDIVALTEAKAKIFLQQSGLLPGCRDRPTYLCWECGHRMVSKSEKHWRCDSCPKRPRLHDTGFVYTPWQGNAKSGEEASYTWFLRPGMLIFRQQVLR